MNNYFIKLLTITCILNVLFVDSVMAVSNKGSDISRLIQSSDLIVQGRFSRVSTLWENNKVYTKGVFLIDKTIKGNADGSIVVKKIGGTIIHPVLKTEITMKTSNGINFRLEDEVILMLDLSSNDEYVIKGMQGMLKVETINGIKVVSGIRKIIGKNETGDNVVSSRKMTIDEFSIFVRENGDKN